MRVAIANDSPSAVAILRRALESEFEHTISWVAKDGAEAVELCANDPPDVLLLDLMMPVMDGAQAARRIMARAPCAILVVSAVIKGRLSLVYEAMGAGALDAVAVPTMARDGTIQGGDALLRKIAMVAKLLGKPVLKELPCEPVDIPIVAIGASTGGPQALARVLAALPAHLPASVLVVQHIGVEFASGLVTWFAERSPFDIQVATSGARPRVGLVLIAATDDHIVMGPGGTLLFVAEPLDAVHRPSVDVLFESLARRARTPGVAVLLTGMGRDGATGLAALRRAGWHTIAQDEATSVVWGMPRAAVELGAAVEVLPLEQVAASIAAHVVRR